MPWSCFSKDSNPNLGAWRAKNSTNSTHSTGGGFEVHGLKLRLVSTSDQDKGWTTVQCALAIPPAHIPTNRYTHTNTLPDIQLLPYIRGKGNLRPVFYKLPPTHAASTDAQLSTQHQSLTLSSVVWSTVSTPGLECSERYISTTQQRLWGLSCAGRSSLGSFRRRGARRWVSDGRRALVLQGEDLEWEDSWGSRHRLWEGHMRTGT